ncbi:hypothetical protein ABKW12_20855 [Enterobacter hormaechei]|uniref:hypothetical protein n=1 Tax=Enterobacter hormaechei TaxID=158836 RepID=UPI002876D4F7|nr:hypothetical protein [Enterobacter hormaechei subsp. steigerwaltii]
MSNIDKKTLADDESVKTYYIHPAAFGSTKNPGYGHVAVVRAEDFEKLRIKLEAAENLAKQQGNIAVALFDEVTTLRRNADDKAPELRSQLEEAEKRIADQRGIIASARKFIIEYAGLGDVGAAEFIKIIDRAVSGKGASS